MPQNKRLTKAVNDALQTAQVAQAWVETYGDQIPEEFGSLIITHASIGFLICIESWDRNKKDLILAKVKAIFGDHGWELTAADGRAILSKLVAGVQVKVNMNASLCAPRVVASLETLAV